MTGRPVVTAEAMRAAEAAAIAAGTSVAMLMERAGAAAAEAIARFAGSLSTLVLCGPGNNGGDGYVIARILSEKGFDVRVAALGDPKSEAARQARGAWTGEVEGLEVASSADLLVDALFGTGLRRGLEEPIVHALLRLAGEAQLRVAIDLPSGVSTDDGRLLSQVPDYDLTISFATPKPAHLLQPAARHIGRLVVADIGVGAQSDLVEIDRPQRPAPGADDHKYSRGYVAVMAGDMPGAAALTAAAASRSGAGYVRLIADVPIGNVPKAVVQGPSDGDMLRDPRVGVIAIGPGLGRGSEAEQRLADALGSGRPLVVDADALTLLAGKLDRLAGVDAILTPHAGEFARLFGLDESAGKVEQCRAAARASGAVVLFKGADTVVASPDGRAAIAPPAPYWLASAGTGDVLTGIIAAMRASGMAAFEAACAGAWLHGRAAEVAGPHLIADDLIEALPAIL